MTVATAPTTQIETQPLLLDITNTTVSVTPEQFDREIYRPGQEVKILKALTSIE